MFDNIINLTIPRVRTIFLDLVIEVGTHSVSNLRTAEAVKVVENSQRDINIAFMNELAMVFDKMNIDTNEVVDGMNTKWNGQQLQLYNQRLLPRLYLLVLLYIRTLHLFCLPTDLPQLVLYYEYWNCNYLV